MTGCDLGEFLNLIYLIATTMGILVQDTMFEVAGERKCTFKCDSSSLKWRVCVLSSFRQYQRSSIKLCYPLGIWFGFSVECEWGATSPTSESNPCDGLTWPSSYQTTKLWLPSQSLLISQDVSGTGGGKLGLWEGWTLKEKHFKQGQLPDP